MPCVRRLALDVDEEERLRADDGAAQAEAVVVALEIGGFGRGEEVPRVEPVPPEEAVRRTRAGEFWPERMRDVHLAATGRAELGRVEERLDLHFLDGIERGRHRHPAPHAVVDWHAVEEEVVGVRTVAIDVDRVAGERELSAKRAADLGRGARRQDRRGR